MVQKEQRPKFNNYSVYPFSGIKIYHFMIFQMSGTPHTNQLKSFWNLLRQISAKSMQWLNIGLTGSTPGEINKCEMRENM